MADATNADVLTVLVRARELVAQGWCQGAFARDADGESVGDLSSLACSWCATGAIRRAALELCSPCYGRLVFWKAISRFGRRRMRDIPGWNDHPGRTKAEVLRRFDRVILRVRKEPEA